MQRVLFQIHVGYMLLILYNLENKIISQKFFIEKKLQSQFFLKIIKIEGNYLINFQFIQNHKIILIKIALNDDRR